MEKKTKEMKIITQKQFNDRISRTKGNSVEFVNVLFEDIEFTRKDKNMFFTSCKFVAGYLQGALGISYLDERIKGSFTNSKFDNCIFEHAILDHVDFDGCMLDNCTFDCCKFIDCNFKGASIRNTTFVSCRITGFTSFIGTGFINCDFENSVINFQTVSFANAFIRRTKGLDSIPMACPSDGSFIGWKKVIVWKDGAPKCIPYIDRSSIEYIYIVKLEIPAKAKRSSATSSKCRCNYAKVLGIYNAAGTRKAGIDEVFNANRAGAMYTVGKYVYADEFDDNRWNECSHGIHFFVDKQNAVNYGFN